MKKNNQFGFTLIEIMVVIGLIGILSAVGYASFGDARAIARDKTRMASLKELQLAIELYKDTYGRYPQAGCGATEWVGPGAHDPDWGNEFDCPEYIVGLVPEFMSALPRDPKDEMLINVGFIYRTDANGDEYKAMVNYTVESLFVTSYDNEFARCPEDMGIPHCGPIPIPGEYAVYNGDNARWW